MKADEGVGQENWALIGEKPLRRQDVKKFIENLIMASPHLNRIVNICRVR